MTRIFVTGGAGFIGTNFIRLATKKVADVSFCILDCLHPQIHGADAVAPQFPSNVKFIKGNILDRELVAATLKEFRPTHILHLAAETGTGQSMDEVTRYCEVNVVGTAILLEEIRKHASGLKKFVLTSSRAIYGEGPWLNKDQQIVFPEPRLRKHMEQKVFLPYFEGALCAEPVATTEQSEVRPASVYASTKLMQEYLVRQARQVQDWSAVILRFQNVYGPGQSLKNPYTGVLSIFSQQILQGKTLNVYEDGHIIRDFVYIDDIANAIIQSCQQELPNGATFNIGSGVASSLEGVAKLLLKFLGKDQTKYFVSGDFRDGDIRHAVADISLAKAQLNWEPQVSLEAGLKNLCDWVKQQQKSQLSMECQP